MKQNILTLFFTLLLGYTGLYAEKATLIIHNHMNQDVRFKIDLLNDTQMETSWIGANTTEQLTYDDFILRITRTTNANTTLTFAEPKDTITVHYVGGILVLDEEYQNTMDAKIAAIRQKISAQLTAAWNRTGSMLQNIRTSLQKYYPAPKKAPVSGMVQCHIINKVGYPIYYRLSQPITKVPSFLPIEKTYRFTLHNVNSITIYSPPSESNPEPEKVDRIIQLTTLTQNPPANSDLYIYIQPRNPVVNKLFGWMPNWSNITYSATWVPWKSED